MAIIFDTGSASPVTLPDDLVVKPELSAVPDIDQKVETARSGALIRWEQARKSAKIDLVGGDNWGWATRSTMAALMAKTATADATYVLNVHGTAINVCWRFDDFPVIEFEEVMPIRISDQYTTDYCMNITLKFYWIKA